MSRQVKYKENLAKMKRTVVIVGLTIMSSLVALATDDGATKYETFLGYSFVRFETQNGIVPSFNANGGGGQFVYNFTKDIGVVLDVGAVTKGILGGHSVDTTLVNFVAGPRYTWHNHSRFTPFVQALFGGAYGTTSTQISIPVSSAGTPTNPIVVPPPFEPVVTPHGSLSSTVPISARLVASDTHFAMIAGGGIDLKVNKHLSFRPIGIDYFQTRFPNLLDVNHIAQHNFRYTTGLNFTFGAE
jgi:hypothetical protein